MSQHTRSTRLPAPVGVWQRSPQTWMATVRAPHTRRSCACVLSRLRLCPQSAWRDVVSHPDSHMHTLSVSPCAS